MELAGVILLVGGLIGGVLLLVFLIYGLKPLIRWYIKSTGEAARATILDVNMGKWVVYSGSEYSGNVQSQQVILKLEVHPNNGAVYVAEDKFMARAMDLMRLRQGCDIQVRIASNNPKRVVCLPETVTAPAGSPVQARAGLAMADFAEQVARGGSFGTEQVMEALRAQGIVPAAMPSMPGVQGDPKERLAKLKEMLDSGLISPQEYEAKKQEILSQM